MGALPVLIIMSCQATFILSKATAAKKLIYRKKGKNITLAAMVDLLHFPYVHNSSHHTSY